MLATAVKLTQFVETTESVSTTGDKSKGEDMDVCLEEVNSQRFKSVATWLLLTGSEFSEIWDFEQGLLTIFT